MRSLFKTLSLDNEDKMNKHIGEKSFFYAGNEQH
jgi:hypothetical protein